MGKKNRKHQREWELGSYLVPPSLVAGWHCSPAVRPLSLLSASGSILKFECLKLVASRRLEVEEKPTIARGFWFIKASQNKALPLKKVWFLSFFLFLLFFLGYVVASNFCCEISLLFCYLLVCIAVVLLLSWFFHAWTLEANEMWLVNWKLKYNIYRWWLVAIVSIPVKLKIWNQFNDEWIDFIVFVWLYEESSSSDIHSFFVLWLIWLHCICLFVNVWLHCVSLLIFAYLVKIKIR